MIRVILKTALLGLAFGISTNLSCMAGADETIKTLNPPGQNTPKQNKRVFKAGYFKRYAPRTALDMISQIPGFQIRKSEEKRGLGQGGANILINGARLSGKSDAGERLAQINAADVKRIEIQDGAALNIPGLSGQVANLVVETTSFSGNWDWNPWFRKNLEANLLRGGISLSGQKGKLEWSTSIRSANVIFGNWGIEDRRLADGRLFEQRDEFLQFTGDRPQLGLTLRWTPKPDHIFNVQADHKQNNFLIREISKHKAFTNRGNDNETQFFSGQDLLFGRLATDYSFPLGLASGDKLKLIAITRLRDRPIASTINTFAQSQQIGGQRFTQARQSGESIARMEYSWKGHEKADWQFNLEGAFNFLDIKAGLQVLDTASGAYTNVPVPGASSRVEEERAETALSYSRALGPKFDFQTSVGVEYSRLRQTGANGKARSFVRPKGFVLASYKPSDDFSIRGRIERKVGQLNFSDFVSSLNLQDSLASTGNVNLVPDQTWSGEVEFDKNFGSGNTVKLRLYNDQISDLVDRIPVGTNGDAVGNIDTAHAYGFDINATIKGEKWGWDGTQLDLVFDQRWSNVDDPLTGRGRRLNDDKIWLWQARFRHDIPKTDWAWGGQIDHLNKSLTYRLNTISTPGGPELQTKPALSVFVEHKSLLGLKIKLELDNVLGTQDKFQRQIFTDRRDIGRLDIIEAYERDFGQTVRLTVNGQF